jgi:CRP-like cAMP-binding protein
MTRSEITAAVHKIKPRFLDGLTAEELKAVLAPVRVRKYMANAIVSHQGHPASELFLLLSGRARFFTLTPEGQKTSLYWVPPGDTIGGAAILSRPCDYVLSAQTVAESRFLVWRHSEIFALGRAYPRLLENGLLIAHDYLVFYRAAHLSLVCQNARQRLATVLVNLATGIGRKVPEGVQLDVNNEELANEANVTHFTASRLMSEWQRSGMLIKRRGKVLLPSPELLSQEA